MSWKIKVYWNGKKCETVEMRRNIYERTRQHHLEWLNHIIFVNEKRLETNKMGIFGFDITTMACILYDKLTVNNGIKQ